MKHEYVLSYFTKIFELQLKAYNKGLRLEPHYCISYGNYLGSHLDDNYEIYDIETGEQMRYSTLDPEFDDGSVFTYNEAEEYIKLY